MKNVILIVVFCLLSGFTLAEDSMPGTVKEIRRLGSIVIRFEENIGCILTLL